MNPGGLRHNLSFEDPDSENPDGKILIENFLESREDNGSLDRTASNRKEIEDLIEGVSYSGEGLSGSSDDEMEMKNIVHNYTDENGIQISYAHEDYHGWGEGDNDEKNWEVEDNNFDRNYQGFFGRAGGDMTQNFSREDENEIMEFPQITAPSVELSKNNSFRESGMQHKFKSPNGDHRNEFDRSSRNAFEHLVEKGYGVGSRDEDGDSKDDRYTVLYHSGSQTQNDDQSEEGEEEEEGRESSIQHYAEIYGLSLESSIHKRPTSHLKDNQREEQTEINFLKDDTYARVLKAIENDQNDSLKHELEDLIKMVYRMEIEKRNWVFHHEQLQAKFDLLQAETNEDIDIMVEKMLGHAKMQIEQLKTLLEQKDEEIAQLIHNMKFLEIENKSLKNTIQNEMKEIVDEIEKGKVIAESYRMKQVQLEKLVEDKDNTAWTLNQKLEEMSEVIKQKDGLVKEREFNLMEANNRMKEMINLLKMREEEIGKMQDENSKLKQVIEQFKNGAEEKEEKKQEEMKDITNQERMRYEFENQQLRRRIKELEKSTQERINNPNDGGNIFSQLVQEDFGIESLKPVEDNHGQDGYGVDFQNQFNQNNQEVQCKIIEEMFGEWLSLLLIENSLCENCEDMNLGELQQNVRISLKKYVNQVEELIVNREDRRNIEDEVKGKLGRKFKKEIEDLKKMVIEKETEIGNLIEENTNLGQKYQTMHKRSVEEKADLREEMERWRDEYEEKIQDLESELEMPRPNSDYLEMDREEVRVTKCKETQTQIGDTENPKTKANVEMRETAAMTEFSNSITFAAQVNISDDQNEIQRLKLKSAIEELESKVRHSKARIAEKNKVISDLKTKCRCLEERMEKVKEEAFNVTERGTAQLSTHIKSLEDKLSTRNKDLRGKDKKNVELYKEIKQLKKDNSSLNEKNENLSEEILRLHQQYKKQLKDTERDNKIKEQGEEKRREMIQDYVEEAIRVKQELEKVKIETVEMYQKLDQLYVEKNILYETLNKQLARNKMITKENEFLRLTLDNTNNSPQTIELELLSSDETKELLKIILSKAAKSKSLQRSIKTCKEFKELCRKLEGQEMRGGHQKILAYENMNIRDLDEDMMNNEGYDGIGGARSQLRGY